jgi:membrane-bound lytic murein transglycosylase D
MISHIVNKPGRRAATAAAVAMQLLALASPVRADAMSAQDDAGIVSAATILASAPSRPEPQRSAGTSASAAEGWGQAGPPLRSHVWEAEYGIPMPWGQEKFESLRAAYLTPDGKKWLAAIQARAKPYIPYIVERIRYYGLPDELAFLPVIESEFSPRNVSRSGAAGLWQFMRNSIHGYGMKIDDWVDERRDFMKSTDGALRKLADNYSAFGDWDLALAAYNCGAGAITRAIAAAKRKGIEEPSYWDLREAGLLKKETAGYVPKFLAVASILRYPGRHGLEPSWEEPVSWATVSPGRPVDLKILADEADIPYNVLRDANIELRYCVTPPGSAYELKVPADREDRIRAIVEDNSRKLVRYYLHTVRSGDTLSEIARRYGTPVATIAGSNPGMQPDRIRLGQVIVVPALKEAPPPEPADKEGEERAFSSTYVVAKGDTLWSISLRYEVQPELLAERNSMGLSSVIREGMTLRVPILNQTP